MKKSFRQIQLIFSEVMQEVNNPPIRLWAWRDIDRFLWPSQLKAKDKLYAWCNPAHGIIAINPETTNGQIMNSIWHELGHILFRKKPHWWIEMYAFAMSKRAYHGEEWRKASIKFHPLVGPNFQKYKKDGADLMFRGDLLRLSRKAVHRLKSRFCR